MKPQKIEYCTIDGVRYECIITSIDIGKSTDLTIYTDQKGLNHLLQTEKRGEVFCFDHKDVLHCHPILIIISNIVSRNWQGIKVQANIRIFCTLKTNRSIMTKYMTMPEAFKCEGNDSPFIDGEFNSDKDFTKKGLLELSEYDGFKPWPSPKNQLSDQWQVQKAEPKVLTVEELWNENFQADLQFTLFKKTHKKIHQNGRLERDLEVRPVIDALDKTLESISYQDQYQKTTAYKTLVACIENLKPLNNGTK